MTKLNIKNKVYCCNCGDLFTDRLSLILHIKNKKKGKNKDLHYGGDYVTGNKTGLNRFVYIREKGKNDK